VQGTKHGTLSNEVTRQPMDFPTLIKSATPATKRGFLLQEVGTACTEATACMFELRKPSESAFRGFLQFIVLKRYSNSKIECASARLSA